MFLPVAVDEEVVQVRREAVVSAVSAVAAVVAVAAAVEKKGRRLGLGIGAVAE